jgi:hypothetical protein
MWPTFFFAHTGNELSEKAKNIFLVCCHFLLRVSGLILNLVDGILTLPCHSILASIQ